MKYRGVRYEIRARPGKNEWSWIICPAGEASQAGEIKGLRQRAAIACQVAIDRFLKKSRLAKPANEESDQERSPGFF
jgi:hypothetical protein